MSDTSVPPWTLADRLTKARRIAGLTQDDMAERIGLSRQSIAKFEVGKPVRLAYVVAWADTCQVPLDWLRYGLGDWNEPRVPPPYPGSDQPRRKFAWSMGAETDDAEDAPAGRQMDQVLNAA